jgi:hypothetical protein
MRGHANVFQDRGTLRQLSTKNCGVNDVKAGQEFVEAYINFLVCSHPLHARVKQEQSGGDEHEHRCA